MERCGISPGICLLCVTGKCSSHFHNTTVFFPTSIIPCPWNLCTIDLVNDLPVSTVPPLPVPLLPEETEVLHPVECHCPMQLVPARLKECVAADFPHLCRLPLHRPHPQPQTPRQN